MTFIFHKTLHHLYFPLNILVGIFRSHLKFKNQLSNITLNLNFYIIPNMIRKILHL